MNKFIKKLHNKKGMTLIEVVVAFAIVAVVSVVIVIGFRTMGAVLKEGSDMSRLDQQLEQEIATSSSSEINSTDASITMTVSNTSITINGEINEYYKDKDGDRTQSFRIFEANEEGN